jgi:cyclopropane fatty-acyl-phospholipid synthase-like methyltransferase
MDNEGKKYDLIASGFSEMRDSFYKEQKYIDLLMDYLQPGDSILDIGCGSGHPIASYLVDHGFQVTGVDSSKELLKIAGHKCPKMHTIFGDIRTVDINNQFDAIIEWWCLFHLPKEDHSKMIARFSKWLKKGGVLEFTSGDKEYQGRDSAMLNQELNYYSLNPDAYEKYLEENNFKLLLRESDQDQHLVWIAQKV